MIEILVGLVVMIVFLIPAYFLGKYLCDPYPNDPYPSGYDRFMRTVGGLVIMFLSFLVLLIAHWIGQAILY